jgi:RNA polymerase sigma factor (sigma-70 family)
MTLSLEQITLLVKGCRANERSAQESLYHLFYAQMMRLCSRYLKTDELAKEALNVGFLKVFQHIQTYSHSKGELGAWIHTIMVRTCIDLARKEGKFATIQDQNFNEDIFVDASILSKLYAEDILKYIRQLPTVTQLVFNLSVIDGYTHKEISEQLKMTQSTSRWHLTAAKKQLRSLLTPKDMDNDGQTETKKQ